MSGGMEFGWLSRRAGYYYRTIISWIPASEWICISIVECGESWCLMNHILFRQLLFRDAVSFLWRYAVAHVPRRTMSSSGSMTCMQLARTACPVRQSTRTVAGFFNLARWGASDWLAVFSCAA